MGIFVGQMQPFNGIGANDQFGVVGPPMDITNGGRGSDPVVPLAPTLPTPEPVSRETRKQGGSKSSPKSLERRRRMAEALLGQGMDTSPISSPWQGAARLANALVGGMAMRKADQEETAGRDAANAAFMSAVQGGKLDAASLGALMGDPYLSEGQQALATKLWQQQQPQWETFTDKNTGDVMRYNVNDPNSRPEMFFDAPAPTPDPFTLGAGDVRFDGNGNPIARGLEKPSNFEEEYNGYLRAQQQGIASGRIPPDTQPYTPEEFMAKKQAQTNINTAGETAYSKERGGQFAKDAGAFQQAGVAANNTLTQLDVMDQAMSDPNFYSGFGADQLTTLKQAMVAMGGNPDMVSSTETFAAAAKNAALSNMGGSLGSGFSNADRDFVERQVPSLAYSPQGNKAIIGVNRKIQERKIQIAQMAMQYEAQNGQLDIGFYKQLSDWSQQNPLFPPVQAAPQMQQPQSGSGPQPGMIEDGYRFKGGNPGDPSSWEPVQ